MTFASALNCRSKQTVAFTAINSRNSRSLLVQYMSMSDVLLKYLPRHELLKLVKLSVVSAQVQVTDEWMSTPAGLCAVFPTAGSTSSCRSSAIRWTNLPRPRVDFLRAPTRSVAIANKQLKLIHIVVSVMSQMRWISLKISVAYMA